MPQHLYFVILIYAIALFVYSYQIWHSAPDIEAYKNYIEKKVSKGVYPPITSDFKKWDRLRKVNALIQLLAGIAMLLILLFVDEAYILEWILICIILSNLIRLIHNKCIYIPDSTPDPKKYTRDK